MKHIDKNLKGKLVELIMSNSIQKRSASVLKGSEMGGRGLKQRARVVSPGGSPATVVLRGSNVGVLKKLRSPLYVGGNWATDYGAIRSGVVAGAGPDSTQQRLYQVRQSPRPFDPRAQVHTRRIVIGGQQIRAVSVESDGSPRENRDLDAKAFSIKGQTDFLNSERDCDTPGKQVQMESTELPAVALATQLGRQGRRPTVNYLNPHVISQRPEIIVTNFQQKVTSLGQSPGFHEIRKRSALKPHLEKELMTFEQRKLSVQTQSENSSAPEEFTFDGSTRGRVVPPVVMDLIPDELGECHVDGKLSGACSTMIQRARKKMIHDGGAQQHSGRRTEMRNQPPKWMWEEGQMRLNSTCSSGSRDFRSGSIKGLFCKKQKGQGADTLADVMNQTLIEKKGRAKIQRKLQRALKDLQVTPHRVPGLRESRSPRILTQSGTGESSMRILVPTIQQAQPQPDHPLFTGVLKQKGSAYKGSYQGDRSSYLAMPNKALKLPQKQSASTQALELLPTETVEQQDQMETMKRKSNELPNIHTPGVEQSLSADLAEVLHNQEERVEAEDSNESSSQRRVGIVGGNKLQGSSTVSCKDLASAAAKPTGPHKEQPKTTKKSPVFPQGLGHASPTFATTQAKLDRDAQNTASTKVRKYSQASCYKDYDRGKDASNVHSTLDYGLSPVQQDTLPLMNISQLVVGRDHEATQSNWLQGTKGLTREMSDCININLEVKQCLQKNEKRDGRAERQKDKETGEATEAARAAAGLGLSQSCKFVPSNELQGPGRADQLPRGNSMMDTKGAQKNLNVFMSSRKSIGANGPNAATSGPGSFKEQSNAALKSFRVGRDSPPSKAQKSSIRISRRPATLIGAQHSRQPDGQQNPIRTVRQGHRGAKANANESPGEPQTQKDQHTEKNYSYLKAQIENNFKNSKRNTLILTQLNKNDDAKDQAEPAPSSTQNDFSGRLRNQFPTGKKRTHKNASEAGEKMRASGDSAKIKKGFRDLEEAGLVTPDFQGNRGAVLQEHEVLRAVESLVKFGPEKLKEMIDEKTSRIANIQAMISAEAQVANMQRSGHRRRNNRRVRTFAGEPRWSSSGRLASSEKVDREARVAEEHRHDEQRPRLAPLAISKLKKRQMHYDSRRRVLVMQPHVESPLKLHPDGTLTNSRDQYSFSMSKEWRLGLATSIGIGGTASGGVVLQGGGDASSSASKEARQGELPRDPSGMFNNKQIETKLLTEAHIREGDQTGGQSSPKQAESKMVADTELRRMSAERAAPEVDADVINLRLSTPGREAEHQDSAVQCSDLTQSHLRTFEAAAEKAKETAEQQQATATQDATAQKPGPKPRKPKRANLRQALLTTSNYGPSRLTKGLAKPLFLPSVGKKQLEGGAAKEAVGAAAVASAGGDQEAAQGNRQTVHTEDRARARQYLDLLTREGELLHQWRLLLLRGAAGVAEGSAEQRTFERVTRLGDAELVEICEGKEEGQQINMQLRERALERVNSTLTKEDKYRFKSADSIHADSQGTVDVNIVSSKDSGDEQRRDGLENYLVSESEHRRRLLQELQHPGRGTPPRRAEPGGVASASPGPEQRSVLVKGLVRSPGSPLHFSGTISTQRMKPQPNCSVTNLQESEATQHHDQLESNRRNFAKTQRIDVIVSNPQVVHRGHLLESYLTKQHQNKTTRPGVEKRPASMLENELDRIAQSISSRPNHGRVPREKPQLIAKLQRIGGTGRQSELQESAESGPGSSERAEERATRARKSTESGEQGPKMQERASSTALDAEEANADWQYTCQANPFNFNLRRNLAKTKYRKYSKAKARRRGSSTGVATLDGRERREQMINELVNQIYQITTATRGEDDYGCAPDGSVRDYSEGSSLAYLNRYSKGFYRASPQIPTSEGTAPATLDLKETLRSRLNQHLLDRGEQL